MFTQKVVPECYSSIMHNSLVKKAEITQMAIN